MTFLIILVASASAVTKTTERCAGEVAASLGRVGKRVAEAGRFVPCPTPPPPPPCPKVEEEFSLPPLGHTVIKDAYNKRIVLSVVPKDKLQDLFNAMTRIEPIPKMRDACICAQRSHLYGYGLAEKYKVETGKLISVPNFTHGYITAQNNTGRTWRYHVANLVMVDVDGKGTVEPYVMDTALFPKGPVPRQVWDEAQLHVGKTHVTNRYALGPTDVDFTHRMIRLRRTEYPGDQSDPHNITKNNEDMINGTGASGCNP